MSSSNNAMDIDMDISSVNEETKSASSITDSMAPATTTTTTLRDVTNSTVPIETSTEVATTTTTTTTATRDVTNSTVPLETAMEGATTTTTTTTTATRDVTNSTVPIETAMEVATTTTTTTTTTPDATNSTVPVETAMEVATTTTSGETKQREEKLDAEAEKERKKIEELEAFYALRRKAWKISTPSRHFLSLASLKLYANSDQKTEEDKNNNRAGRNGAEDINSKETVKIQSVTTISDDRKITVTSDWNVKLCDMKNGEYENVEFQIQNHKDHFKISIVDMRRLMEWAKIHVADNQYNDDSFENTQYDPTIVVTLYDYALFNFFNRKGVADYNKFEKLEYRVKYLPRSWEVAFFEK